MGTFTGPGRYSARLNCREASSSRSAVVASSASDVLISRDWALVSWVADDISCADAEDYSATVAISVEVSVMPSTLSEMPAIASDVVQRDQ